MVIFISNKLNLGGFGPLTSITAPVAAMILWRKQSKTSDANAIAQSRTCDSVLSNLWLIFEVSNGTACQTQTFSGFF